MSQLVRYKATSISCKHWDDDFVIYDQLSGDTHILDVFSGYLISELSKQAMLKIDILATLTALLNDATEAEIENYLLDFIEKFESIGLLISE